MALADIGAQARPAGHPDRVLAIAADLHDRGRAGADQFRDGERNTGAAHVVGDRDVTRDQELEQTDR